jgi:SecD/SecF fusion protein
VTSWVGCTKASPPPAGAVLIYEVDPQSDAEKAVSMDRIIAAYDRRLNGAANRLAEIHQKGARRVEIGVFGNDPAAIRRVDLLVQTVGALEFRVLANSHDHASLIERAAKEKSDTVRNAKGELVARWVPVSAQQIAKFSNRPGIATRTTRRDGQRRLEVLVIQDSYNVPGNHLRMVTPCVDKMGSPFVCFTLDKMGGLLFTQLTGENLPDPVSHLKRQLGIILDGQLYSAPNIESVIAENGQITGNFTMEEVNNIAIVLNAGPAPVRLKKVGQRAPAAESTPSDGKQ